MSRKARSVPTPAVRARRASEARPGFVGRPRPTPASAKLAAASEAGVAVAAWHAAGARVSRVAIVGGPPRLAVWSVAPDETVAKRARAHRLALRQLRAAV